MILLRKCSCAAASHAYVYCYFIFPLAASVLNGLAKVLINIRAGHVYLLHMIGDEIVMAPKCERFFQQVRYYYYILYMGNSDILQILDTKKKTCFVKEKKFI